jgi:hypothetical protein
MYEFILIVKSTHLNIMAISNFSLVLKNLEQKMPNLTKKIPYDKDKI